jgi:hypothetical protein
MSTTDIPENHEPGTPLGLGSSAVLGVSACDEELFGGACPGERGNTRAPKFGEWMRGVWASKRNPHRDGMFVRTVRRTGRMNPGTWHELTDGKGNFWQYEASSTVFLTPNAE